MPEAVLPAEPMFQMWVLFALILGALFLYARESVAMELTSLGVLAAVLLFFHAFPVVDETGQNLLAAPRLLHGFANPALLTVLALLVIGQGMVRTGILELAARQVLRLGGNRRWVTLLLTLVAVLVISAFLNNIPVVVIFIPIMQAIARRFNAPASKLMMPLSFAAVVGGMTTLVGSGTNLLVSSALIELGLEGFGFFDFTIPGLVLAVTGLAYSVAVAPRLLPERVSLGQRMRNRANRQYIAEITVGPRSKLVGQKSVGGLFPGLPNLIVRMVHRQGQTFLPPFEDYQVLEDDVLVVAATRDALTEALFLDPGLLRAKETNSEGKPRVKRNPLVAEVMVPPASQMIDRTLDQIGFEQRGGCRVLGVQRRARMIRSRMGEIRLEAGDQLLVECDADNMAALRLEPDVVTLEWSAEEVPKSSHAYLAIAIFAGVVLLAASGLVPIVVASITGAFTMIAANVLNVRQAIRAIDAKVVTTIVAALALGASMQETGGAAYLARLVLSAIGEAGPGVALSAFFILVAVLANIISTKTCAVLFTPIGVGIAVELGLDPRIFAVTVVFAANCAFATPIAYQTSLLVMGPGSYRFKDYLIAGSPLLVLIWIVFSVFAPWYYGL